MKSGGCFLDDGGFLVFSELDGQRALTANDRRDGAFRGKAA